MAIDFQNTHDISLLETSLQHSANPNKSTVPFDPPFRQCRSLQAAQLLLQHGANIYEQHQQGDLIVPFCTNNREKYDHRLLDLFLPQIPLDETNEFGHKWINHLKYFEFKLPYTTFFQRLSALIRHDCYYDQQDQNLFIANVEKTLPREDADKEKRKKEVTALFEQDQNRRKNIALWLAKQPHSNKKITYFAY